MLQFTIFITWHVIRTCYLSVDKCIHFNSIWNREYCLCAGLTQLFVLCMGKFIEIPGIYV